MQEIYGFLLNKACLTVGRSTAGGRARLITYRCACLPSWRLALGSAESIRRATAAVAAHPDDAMISKRLGY